jgi:hypothetical protein
MMSNIINGNLASESDRRSTRCDVPKQSEEEFEGFADIPPAMVSASRTHRPGSRSNSAMKASVPLDCWVQLRELTSKPS